MRSIVYNNQKIKLHFKTEALISAASVNVDLKRLQLLSSKCAGPKSPHVLTGPTRSSNHRTSFHQLKS